MAWGKPPAIDMCPQAAVLSSKPSAPVERCARSDGRPARPEGRGPQTREGEIEPDGIGPGRGSAIDVASSAIAANRRSSAPSHRAPGRPAECVSSGNTNRDGETRVPTPQSTPSSGLTNPPQEKARALAGGAGGEAAEASRAPSRCGTTRRGRRDARRGEHPGAERVEKPVPGWESPIQVALDERTTRANPRAPWLAHQVKEERDVASSREAVHEVVVIGRRRGRGRTMRRIGPGEGRSR